MNWFKCVLFLIVLNLNYHFSTSNIFEFDPEVQEDASTNDTGKNEKKWLTHEQMELMSREELRRWCKYRLSCYEENGVLSDLISEKQKKVGTVVAKTVPRSRKEKRKTVKEIANELIKKHKIKATSKNHHSNKNPKNSPIHNRVIEKELKGICKYRKSCYDTGVLKMKSRKEIEQHKKVEVKKKEKKRFHEMDPDEKKAYCQYRKSCYDSGIRQTFQTGVSLWPLFGEGREKTEDKKEEVNREKAVGQEIKPTSAKELKIYCKYRKSCYLDQATVDKPRHSSKKQIPRRGSEKKDNAKPEKVMVSNENKTMPKGEEPKKVKEQESNSSKNVQEIENDSKTNVNRNSKKIKTAKATEEKGEEHLRKKKDKISSKKKQKQDQNVIKETASGIKKTVDQTILGKKQEKEEKSGNQKKSKEKIEKGNPKESLRLKSKNKKEKGQDEPKKGKREVKATVSKSNTEKKPQKKTKTGETNKITKLNKTTKTGDTNKVPAESQVKRQKVAIEAKQKMTEPRKSMKYKIEKGVKKIDPKKKALQEWAKRSIARQQTLERKLECRYRKSCYKGKEDVQPNAPTSDQQINIEENKVPFSHGNTADIEIKRIENWDVLKRSDRLAKCHYRKSCIEKHEEWFGDDGKGIEEQEEEMETENGNPREGSASSEQHFEGRLMKTREKLACKYRKSCYSDDEEQKIKSPEKKRPSINHQRILPKVILTGEKCNIYRISCREKMGLPVTERAPIGPNGKKLCRKQL